MSDLERYLRRATRGLPAQQQRAVQAELRANLHQLTLDHQVRGATPEEALERALRDFGPAASLQRGLHQVHTVPTVLRGALAVLALAGGAYAAASALQAAPITHGARP